MPAYADLPTIKVMLNIDTANIGADARLDALNTSLSDLMDRELGRSFVDDGVPVIETRTVRHSGSSPVLMLPRPIASVTGIVYGGSWDGTAWIDSTVLESDSYRLRAVDRYGFAWGIDLAVGWANAYRITGAWADQNGAVPTPVTEALNVLVARHYKIDEAGPSGTVVGPDEFSVRPDSPWSDKRVVKAIDQYRLPEHVL
jgi:hypothetical protein